MRTSVRLVWLTLAVASDFMASLESPPQVERTMAKTAIVTGGGSGIGLALARALGTRGCSTVLVGRRFQTLERAAEQVRGTGRDVLVRAADVRDFAAINAIVEETVERYGHLDYLFNNAGVSMA